MLSINQLSAGAVKHQRELDKQTIKHMNKLLRVSDVLARTIKRIKGAK